MPTRIGSLAATPAQSGLPPEVTNPIRPEWFAGRTTAAPGRVVGMLQFGVNHVTLAPGARSSLRHWHEEEDEFVYVLDGELVLIDDNGEHGLRPGDYAGFPAGAANAHHLVNRSGAPASFLAIGTRKAGVETVHYPEAFDGQPQTVERDALGQRMG